jgi:nicotinamide/nicotinate riboside kinase
MATTPHSGQKVPSTGSNIRRTIVVGVSGPSSSGKTTLARLLRSIFNPPAEISSSDQEAAVRSFILHEDDFYKPDDR